MTDNHLIAEAERISAATQACDSFDPTVNLLQCHRCDRPKHAHLLKSVLAALASSEAALVAAQAEQARLHQELDTTLDRLREATLDDPTTAQSPSELAAVVVSGGWRLRRQRDELSQMLQKHGAAHARLVSQIRALRDQWIEQSRTVQIDRDEFDDQSVEYAEGSLSAEVIDSCAEQLSALLAGADAGAQEPR